MNRRDRKLKKSEVPQELIAKAQEVGEMATEWARSFCLPAERQEVPQNQLTPEEAKCIERASEAIQEEVARELGL